MDLKCVRMLRPYSKDDEDKMILYIDNQTRKSLVKSWGDEVKVLGRRSTTVEIQPLKDLDQDGFVARGGEKLIDTLYVEYGEEVLIIRE